VSALASDEQTVRSARPADATACAEIYAPYVLETAITFEDRPPQADEMAARIESACASHAWVVLEERGRVVGYAYGGRFNYRAAYRWACEVSVYVELGRRRTGAGRALYGDLFERLAARGFCMAAAGMTLPNEASVGLHRAMGFQPVGAFRRIGYKHGRWHDVAWMQRQLAAATEAPVDPR
jgi:L-amino acid N-acyltransferase YncA